MWTCACCGFCWPFPRFLGADPSTCSAAPCVACCPRRCSAGEGGCATASLVERVGLVAAFSCLTSPELSYYIDGVYSPQTNSKNIWAFDSALRVQALNYWLQNYQSRSKIATSEDNDHEIFAGLSNGTFSEKAVQKARTPNLR